MEINRYWWCLLAAQTGVPFSRTDGRGRQEQILAVLHEPAAMVIKSAHLVKIQTI